MLTLESVDRRLVALAALVKEVQDAVAAVSDAVAAVTEDVADVAEDVEAILAIVDPE